MPRLHVRISGRVQGVGFRYAAYRQAESLGLTGWVRNLRDGSVEAEFEGSRATLDTMRSWCDEGPAFARVDAVTADWMEDDQGYSGFEIR